jgi:hypothetical protein
MKCAFDEKHPVRRVGDAVGAPEGAEIRTVASCQLSVASGEQKRELMRAILNPFPPAVFAPKCRPQLYLLPPNSDCQLPQPPDRCLHAISEPQIPPDN